MRLLEYCYQVPRSIVQEIKLQANANDKSNANILNKILVNSIQYRLTSLPFIALHRYCVSLQIKNVWWPRVEQGTIFLQTAFAYFVTLMSHVGNSSNISSSFIIILFVMMICDQWYLMQLIWPAEAQMIALFSNKLLFKCVLFRFDAIAHLMDCNIM